MQQAVQQCKRDTVPRKIETTDPSPADLSRSTSTHLIYTTRELGSFRSALHILDNCNVYIVEFVRLSFFPLVLGIAAAKGCTLCYFGRSFGQALDNWNSSTNHNASLATCLTFLTFVCMHSSCRSIKDRSRVFARPVYQMVCFSQERYSNWLGEDLKLWGGAQDSRRNMRINCKTNFRCSFFLPSVQRLECWSPRPWIV